ncbi:TraR/DksA C4-type zinc finger protein [Cytobacillus sp. S13-E01]|uniref:TraR/DksA C4-type zinc finger protein n=1 Tax=Cytobacillus sp. S13-E01 TaxID=3031326 RepID=UPI0023D87364|nr:TraR/DksA C4-type zinc finger protein [Cytobacillus sp. S13-E01]MDF0728395.1 TraR/DksA C4-type zinc finger protein [Cytobacillus sp. S13-E01]
MLTSEQLSTFRSQLINAKEDIERRLQENDNFDLDNGHYHESMGELSSYDNHPADEGSALYEREKDIALNDHTERELKDVYLALEKIEDGTYGKCEVCGIDIPKERLEVLPTTNFCKDHSPDQVVSHNRPIEEGVLMTPFGKFEFDDEDVEAYDAEDSWQDVARYGTSETPSDINENIDHYNDVYIESHDQVGYVEAYENFAANDIDGNEIRVYPNKQHQRYETELDELGTMTIFGDLPAYEKDPYTEEEAEARE